MQATIEPTNMKHVEGYARAFSIVAKEQQYFGSLVAPPLERIAATVRANIEKNNPQFVATSNGEVIGWCEIVRLEKPLFRHVGIFELGLVPEWRSKGLGRSMIDTALDNARDLGFVRLELTVFAENQRAISLYEKVGFQKEGELIDAVCIDGKYSNSFLMGRVDRSAAAIAGKSVFPT